MRDVKAAVAAIEKQADQKVTEVVSGGATGADEAGEFWAECSGIPVKRFPAEWEMRGKAAGPWRNKLMARYADAAVVFVKNRSRGSLNMIENIRLAGKPHHVVQVDE